MNRFRTKVAAVLVAVGALTVIAVAQAATGDTLGVSTVTQRIVPDSSSGFNFLTAGAGEDYTVRDGSEESAAIGQAIAGRESRRTSLTYFGQLTDFQLADEESPARVEFLDPTGGALTSAWRPGEALNPQEEDAMIRQFNAFSTKPPHFAKGNLKPKMDFVINTGDVSDSNQYNEAMWNLTLLRGGTIDPGSGVDPAEYLGSHPLCPAGLNILDGANPSNYTGVQERGNWPAPTMGYFWDPDQPDPGPVAVNPFADWPSYPGLMNRAQKPFKATGLKVPGYMVFGNHDTLVQGNAYASQIFNEIATGCLKPINDDAANSGRAVAPLFDFVINPQFSAAQFNQFWAENPDYFMAVPPDPDRRLISKKEYMNMYREGGESNGHGWGFTDPAEKAASDDHAAYYSFSPRPGVRFITLDTTSEGGQVLVSSEGNLDDPQFKWFEAELQKAQAKNEVAVVFSHHGVTSLNSNVTDEQAPSCASVDPALVPGCDGDPRNSEPIHLEQDAVDLMLKYPNAIAWVAGHSHVNNVTPYRSENGENGFWSIRTAALADWPKQNRLIEIFDNRDGNLSIFGTAIDHAAGIEAPAGGSNAASMTNDELASLSRVIGHNDNQTGAEACGSEKCGEGTARDRNVELLIKDPRIPRANVNKVTVRPKKRKLRAGKKFKLTVRVSNFVTATADAKKVRVRIKSSNKRVKVRKQIVIAKIQPGGTATIKVPVRALGRARGKSKITVNVNGRKAVSNVKVIAKKRKKRR